jgi:hypothetical protein
LREGFLGFIGALLAIRVAGAYVVGFNEDRKKRLTTPRVSADGERTECVAVITLATSDEMTPLALPFFDEILAREFERGFDRFGTAGREVHMAQAFGRVRY